ncbi:hypothetical protein DL764_005541 [Monosporascus ibericus]|uniref:DUF202 domain-containing protein n=1 Tax=Monosporascus ibericus TaxID=155417 RepID=A0A4Q4T8M8_9PEZI|nr:hypothetical protein DL764_005541 [Monosporascus ibericus]
MAPSWLRLSAPVFKNTGSVARDHLASERTFLAWVRTSPGFVALGLAIERFSQLDIGELLSALAAEHRRQQQLLLPPPQRDTEQERYLVGTLTGLGAGSVLYDAGRYFSNLGSLERGEFRPAYRGAAVLAACVAGLAGDVYGAALRKRAETAESGD